MICSDCGHENKAGMLLCENCGADLYDMLLENVATKQLSNIDSGRLGLNESATTRPVLLYVGNTNQTVMVVPRQNNLMMGRTHEQDAVEVDFSGFGAQDLGVSRKHARLDNEGEKPILFDMGSYNGTFLNGQRLMPQQAYPLESGDEIRLGRLSMRIYYK